MTADEIKELLQLEPLRMEGGFFRETYRSRWMVSPDYLPEGMQGMHSIGTAIYFMITPDSYSRLHRLPGSEIFHFYMGDPAIMLQLKPDGTHETITLGTDLAGGARPQVVVRGHVWMGCHLAPRWQIRTDGHHHVARLFPIGLRKWRAREAHRAYPAAADLIREYTRE